LVRDTKKDKKLSSNDKDGEKRTQLLCSLREKRGGRTPSTPLTGWRGKKVVRPNVREDQCSDFHGVRKKKEVPRTFNHLQNSEDGPRGSRKERASEKEKFSATERKGNSLGRHRGKGFLSGA